MYNCPQPPVNDRMSSKKHKPQLKPATKESDAPVGVTGMGAHSNQAMMQELKALKNEQLPARGCQIVMVSKERL